MAAFNFQASEVRVEPTYNAKNINVTVETEVGDLLSDIELDDAIGHYGQDEVLDEIGEDKVMEYFGLEKPAED